MTKNIFIREILSAVKKIIHMEGSRLCHLFNNRIVLRICYWTDETKINLKIIILESLDPTFTN